jgi:hypothetical protein
VQSDHDRERQLGSAIEKCRQHVADEGRRNAELVLTQLLMGRLNATADEFIHLSNVLRALAQEGTIKRIGTPEGRESASSLASEVIGKVTTALANAGLSGLVSMAAEYDTHLGKARKS